MTSVALLIQLAIADAIKECDGMVNMLTVVFVFNQKQSFNDIHSSLFSDTERCNVCITVYYDSECFRFIICFFNFVDE